MLKQIFILILSLYMFSAHCQDEFDDMLDGLEEEERIFTIATFKGSRITNLHTVESVAKNNLEFRISHRFGSIAGGGYEFFGLDQSTIRMALEYGLNDFINIGIGRSTYQKTLDSFIKIKLLRQSKGSKIVPVSMSYLAGIYMNGLRWQNPDRNNYFTSRLSYAHQLIIARKITKSLSVLVSPTIIHRNLVKTIDDQNTRYAVGFGARIKLTKRLALTGEYIYRIKPAILTPDYSDFYNSMSFGFELETGGHVFQLQFSNSLAMMEKGFILETAEQWKNIGIHFGFNISREFSLNKH